MMGVGEVKKKLRVSIITKILGLRNLVVIILLSWGKNQSSKISFFNILGLQYIRLVVGHIGLGLRRQTLSLGKHLGVADKQHHYLYL